MVRSTRGGVLTRLLAAACLLLPLLTRAALHPAPDTEASSADARELARRILVQVADVREGEIVLIHGWPRDLPLLEELAVQARRLGAHPLLTLTSDALSRRLVADVPERFDSQEPRLDLALLDVVDVWLCVCGADAPDVLAGVPAAAARRAARNAAYVPVIRKQLESDVRYVEIGNELYPTPWRAARLGLSRAELARLFWRGIDVDYSKMRAMGAKLATLLEAGRRLRVRTADGTDLTMSIEGRRAHILDGVISAADREEGGLALAAFLPAGEALIAPVPGTASGTLVIDRVHVGGQEARNLRLRIGAGRITAMTGSGPGFAALEARFAAMAGSGATALAFVDVGFNPRLQLPARARIGSWAAAGTVTVGVGNNEWIGGENRAPLQLSGHLRRATVLVDGIPLVQAGRLALE